MSEIVYISYVYRVFKVGSKLKSSPKFGILRKIAPIFAHEGAFD